MLRSYRSRAIEFDTMIYRLREGKVSAGSTVPMPTREHRAWADGCFVVRD